jgi:sigma-B regulation protein RsbU (phosphoserine phosphatase)
VNTGGMRRILVVDDVRSNLDLLVNALSGDYRLSVAIDGASALRAVERTPPDLVLLDVDLPGMSGIEVCRKLRANAATRELPIVFLTALSDVSQKTAGFEAGGNDYVTKPFDVRELRARVRALLEARAWQEAQRMRLSEEMRIAREIHQGLMPSRFETRVGALPVRVAAWLEPAREVGGDLFDVFRTQKQHLGFYIGDVSGKGVPAAIFMARSTTLLRSEGRHSDDPGTVLRAVNTALVEDNVSSMFVTSTMCFLDPVSGALSWSSAGHGPPLILRRGEQPRRPTGDLGTVLGIVNNLEFSRNVEVLRPDDIVVMVTDGITEAMDADRVCFGEDRLVDALKGLPTWSADSALAAIKAAVAKHTAGVERSDDIAVLALQWLAEELSGGRWQRTIRAEPGAIMDLVRTIRRLLTDAKIAPSICEDMAVVVEELLANVRLHAYQLDESRPVLVEIEVTPTCIKLAVEDEGSPFDPVATHAGLSPEARDCAGGLGWTLIRRLTDKVEYERSAQRNRVRVTRCATLDRPVQQT